MTAILIGIAVGCAPTAQREARAGARGPVPREPATPLVDARVSPRRPLVPSLDDVLAVRIEGFVGFPPRNELPEPLRADRPADRDTIAKIMGWLGDAEVVEGETNPQPGRGRIVRLAVELRGGGSFTLEPAYDCVTTRSDDSTHVRCAAAPGQLFYRRAGGAATRIRAPELAAWLADGWRKELNVRQPSAMRARAIRTASSALATAAFDNSPGTP